MSAPDGRTRHPQPDSLDDRLALIAQFADGLMDFLHGDGWTLAHAIREVAKGEMSLAEANAEMTEGMY